MTICKPHSQSKISNHGRGGAEQKDDHGKHRHHQEIPFRDGSPFYSKPLELSLIFIDHS